MATQQAEFLQLVKAASQNVKAARLLDADWPPGTLERADVALEETLGAVPVVATEDWSQFISGAAGLVGKTKWKSGSLGCDIFVPRGTIVRAPFAGHAKFELLPDIVGPHGEVTLVRGDGFTVRFRHVLAQGDEGDVALGQPVALVYDGSLDTLQWPLPGSPPPDGYQHVDVSVASRPDRIVRDGGMGGDINAYRYLFEQHGGIPRVAVIDHTPGPGVV
jgi:hypothetical protein